MYLALTGTNPVACLDVTGDYQPGDVLGAQYTVVETLGRGSSGVTYKAGQLTALAISSQPAAVYTVAVVAISFTSPLLLMPFIIAHVTACSLDSISHMAQAVKPFL